MLTPGEYSDTLRALGRFVEILGGIEVKVVDHEAHVELSWLGRSAARDERRWTVRELDALRTTIRQFRGLTHGTPQFTASELLRTVGRELDAMNAERVTVMETTDGFWVSAQASTDRFGQLYSYSDLVARSQAFHRDRPPEEVTQEGALGHKPT